MRDIVIIREFPYSPELIWAALTESEQLAAWLMKNDFQPVVGHDFTFITDPAPCFDGVVRAKVLAVEPMKHLKIAWRGGPLDTILTFDLEEISGGVRLTLRHAGFRGVSNVLPRLFLGNGWKGLLKTELAAVLEAARAKSI